MYLNGSEILVECLKEQGVDVIFGYPGGAVLNIYDALYNHRHEIRHIRTAHEQAAAHAADGYARATGRIGVCLATSGPGATNLVTGIATAYMDSIPLVAITGNVSMPLLGKDSFQEVDIAGITMPITKHNAIVKDINDLAQVLRRAFAIAGEGRPGPVLIDIPKDITAQEAEYFPWKPEPAARKKLGAKSLQSLEKIAKLIDSSVRPFIYAGGGVIASGAHEELANFVEKVKAPIALSSMGLGGYPGDSPYFTGMLGMHGTAASNYAATECDLFIAAGVRFSDRAVSDARRFAPNAKIVQLDIDPAEINKNIPVANHAIGDLKELLGTLTDMVSPGGMASPDKKKEWLEHISEMKADYAAKPAPPGILRPQHVIEGIGNAIKGKDAIVVTEVGQHQMWACHLIQYLKPRTFLSSGGLGTMGYGLGAAIGASIGCPGKVVVNIAGDGCFRMNLIELATAVEQNVPVVEVVISNHTLGMVKQWQEMFYGKRYSHTSLDRTADFVKLAQAFNAEAISVKSTEELGPALERAIGLKRPVVVNCEVGEDDNVFPMVPPGAGIDQLQLG
ncbi:MAG: biosynthetic-type acetolactate synthase large subunit [Clostridiales bacterium]|jgi:acetolactate synthase-1/2/3 large subunit|nr:biosynthetic-type acetolactate synthase large subunit [Clostridiales bacterium]MDR2750782.1 biosynthetic-type acetolactate synthase large subunit [Clostridiales bacterium]